MQLRLRDFTGLYRSDSRMLLQPLWTFFLGHSSLLLSPFFPVIFSLSVYLSFCLPFLVLDVLSSRWALVCRYKLQPQSSVSWASVRSCLALTLYNHLVFIFPLTVLHWYLRPVHLPEEAPPLPRLLVQVLVCLLLFDFQSFIWHLLHHKVPWLYRNFHKVCTFNRRVLWRLGDPEPGPLRRRQPVAAGLSPAHRAGLLSGQHLAVGGGPLWLRPPVGYPPPGAAGAVRRGPPPRPPPPQVQVQLRPVLHPLGPAGRDAVHTPGLRGSGFKMSF